MNRSQASNKLCRYAFLNSKINPRKHNIHGHKRYYIVMHDPLNTLCRRSTTSSARKPKLSKANGIKTCLLSKHVFSCLATLFDAAFRVACPTTKPGPLIPQVVKPHSSLHMHVFALTHLYNITSTGLSVDLLSSGSIIKFTCASFFINTPARLNISKSTS